jgi:hypothetical protein
MKNFLSVEQLDDKVEIYLHKRQSVIRGKSSGGRVHSKIQIGPGIVAYSYSHSTQMIYGKRTVNWRPVWANIARLSQEK